MIFMFTLSTVKKQHGHSRTNNTSITRTNYTVNLSVEYDRTKDLRIYGPVEYDRIVSIEFTDWMSMIERIKFTMSMIERII